MVLRGRRTGPGARAYSLAAWSSPVMTITLTTVQKSYPFARSLQYLHALNLWGIRKSSEYDIWEM